MDREMFNEVDRYFQEDRQAVLDNKKEELAPKYKSLLQEANLNHVTKLKIISQSNYSYADRQEIEQEERRRFQEEKEALEQQEQNEIQETTAENLERLEEIHFPELGRDGTLKKIEGLEDAKASNLPHQFNETASEKNRKGYLSENFEDKAKLTEEGKMVQFQANKQEVTEEKVTDYNTPSISEEANIDSDISSHGYEAVNDNSPSDGFEP